MEVYLDFNNFPPLGADWKSKVNVVNYCFRILGRRSGSESRDLRMMITDRQKQSEESSSVTAVSRLSEEPQPDNGGIKSQEMEKDVLEGDKSDSRDKPENVSPKVGHRERVSPQRGSRRHENVNRRERAPLGRSAQKNGSGAISRRGGGQRSRPGPRREAGSNVPVPSLLGYPQALPSIFTPVNGLLPLPGLSQVRAALQEKIKSTQTEMQMTVLQMLTNPPPVPGEHVPTYDQHRQQPPTRHGPYGLRETKRKNERHPPKRPQRNVPDAACKSSSRPLLPDHVAQKEEPSPNIVQVPFQKKAEHSGDLPLWLQRTRKSDLVENNDQRLIKEASVNQAQQESTVVKTGGEVSQYEATDSAYRHEAVAPAFQNDCKSVTVNDVNKARLARELGSSTDYNSEMQVLTSKRKSPFHDGEVQHGGKIVIATSPEGLPQPGPAGGQRIHPKGYCFQQLNTGHCTAKSCKYKHLPYAKLVEVRLFGQQALTKSLEGLFNCSFSNGHPDDKKTFCIVHFLCNIY